LRTFQMKKFTLKYPTNPFSRTAQPDASGGHGEETRMIDSLTILTTTLIIAFGLSVVSATLQVIGFDINIRCETENMLNKLTPALNTLTMIVIIIGFLIVFVGW
jgi:hypothetical protein